MTDTYRIRVREHLDDRWSDWLGGLAVERQENGTTVLVGPVVDQAALYGVIIRIRDLGLSLLSVATGTAGAADTAAVNVLGTLLLKVRGLSIIIGATVFAVGSTLYAYLFLRARSIPVPLAWLGIIASLLLVVTLPLQFAGFIKGPVVWFMWIPMLVFEVALGLWLLIKGVAAQTTR